MTGPISGRSTNKIFSWSSILPMDIVRFSDRNAPRRKEI